MLIGCTSVTSDGQAVTPTQSTPASASPSVDEIEVPDLIGDPLGEAKASVRAVGMKVVVVEHEFSAQAMGTVTEQGTPAGSLAEPGGEIEVVVSIFPKVPNLIGLSVKKARVRLAALSLGAGPIVRRPSTEPIGKVLRQGVPAGRRMPADRKVRLVVVGPHVCGAPLNPWCYSVASGGSLIYNPPFNLCSWIDCIPSFWDSTHGYVIQCADGEFSHSGGVSGSCSSHGGNWRPLYA